MQKDIENTKGKKFIIICLTSFFGGVLNGFLGAAGGILLGLVFSEVFKSTDSPMSDRRDLYANIQVAMICISCVSLSVYSSNNEIDLSSALWLVLPALLGGIVGSLILRKISSGAVGKIFAILTIYSGIKMITG